MDCRPIAPVALPHASKLYCDFTSNFGRLKDFYGHEPSFSAIKSYAKSLSFPEERRREVVAVLRQQNRSFGSNASVEANLNRLAKNAVAIVTGQQVGLFGGPAYAFYKALSAIATARELTNQGIEAVPVFWMATEDHDVDEVRQSTWFHDGTLRRFVLSAPAEESVPVGRIPLGADISAIVGEATAQFGNSHAAEISKLLRVTYTPDATYGSAFAKLFAKIFAEHGLILLDPLDPELHRIAMPVLHDALQHRDELNDKLLKRGKDLERAGYSAQVKVTSRSTLLFCLDHAKRQVIQSSGDKFTCGLETLPRNEWLEKLKAHPEHFSPNALLRPVVQDFLLPTAAYFGGPGEIAYYAQSHVIYERLLGRMPVLLPRADFTLVDPKAQRILKKYGLNVEDTWLGPQELLKRMHASILPKKLARDFDASLRQIEKSSAKLHAAIAKVDPTIQGSIARAEKRIKYQIDKLRNKVGEALDRHERILDTHARFLENLLYPQKGLQSRDLCFLQFLARSGDALLPELLSHAGPAKPGVHWVVPIP
jgi:bacillithiol biosynthesis cysteine-adding enzyme BshC